MKKGCHRIVSLKKIFRPRSWRLMDRVQGPMSIYKVRLMFSGNHLAPRGPLATNFCIVRGTMTKGEVIHAATFHQMIRNDHSFWLPEPLVLEDGQEISFYIRIGNTDMVQLTTYYTDLEGVDAPTREPVPCP